MRLMALFSLLTLMVAGASAAEDPPLRLVQTIPLPDVEGRIDHLAIDLDRQRLYVAELGNDTLGVIDLRTGRRVEEISGLSEPQGVIVVPDFNGVLVTNGGTGAVDVFDAGSLARIGSVRFSGDADNIRYDAAANTAFVGYGDGAIGVIRITATGAQEVAAIPLAGHPESFQLERQGPRIFVNVPSAREVMVLDRNRHEVVARWPLSRGGANFPMALDEVHHRLFVGTRRPSALIVLDTETGKEVARREICADADDLFYDGRRARLYLACGAAAIEVLSAHAGEEYASVARIPTAPSARTALFVPEQSRLYLAVPRQGEQRAEIRVYELATPA